MATINILNKRGELIKHEVEETVDTVFMQLTGAFEDSFRPSQPHFLKLTDAKSKGPIIIQSRYIYYVEKKC